jgi:hypothetical protein
MALGNELGLDLDKVPELYGTYLQLLNKAGGGVAFAPGLKLVLDKGSGGVSDYYDAGNSRRVMTIGASDALYLDGLSLDIIGRCLKNPRGLGGATGKSIVFTSKYPTLQALMAEISAGAVVFVDSDILASATSDSPNDVLFIGAGGKIYTTDDVTVFEDISGLKCIGVHFEGSNNPSYVNNRILYASSDNNEFAACEFRGFHKCFVCYRSGFSSSNCWIGNTFLNWYDQAISEPGHYSRILGNRFSSTTSAVYSCGVWAEGDHIRQFIQHAQRKQSSSVLLLHTERRGDLEQPILRLFYRCRSLCRI